MDEREQRPSNCSQQLNSRDWALGAMMLYMDMVNLFMFLMRLFGERE